MNHYKITLERHDGTWGQYDLQAESAARAMQMAAQILDLDNAKQVAVVDMSKEES